MHGNDGIMLDLETLGTEPGAGVLEVGFCTFSYRVLQTRELIQQTGQHYTMTLIDNLRHRMAVKPDTLDWWDFSQGGLPQFSKRSMQASLAIVADELNNLWRRGIRDIWAKPALFDVPILQEAMDTLNIERPVVLRPENFRHWQCFASLRRTVEDIAPEVKDNTEFRKSPTHNALLDAVDQSVQANIIFTVLAAWRKDHHDIMQMRNQLLNMIQREADKKEKRKRARRKHRRSK